MGNFVELQRDCLALPPGKHAVPIMLYCGDLVRPTGRRPVYKPDHSKGAPGLEVMLPPDSEGGEQKKKGPYILLDNQSSYPLLPITCKVEHQA